MACNLWAEYYDLARRKDNQVEHIPERPDEDRLTDNPAICYYSYYNTGIPHANRILNNSDVKVSFTIYIPDIFKHLTGYEQGSLTDDTLSFVKVALSIFNLSGISIPDHMQRILFLKIKENESPS